MSDPYWKCYDEACVLIEAGINEEAILVQLKAEFKGDLPEDSIIEAYQNAAE